MPRPDLSDSKNGSLSESKKENSEGDIRHNSVRSESSINISKPRDMSKLDEVRISNGKLLLYTDNW